MSTWFTVIGRIALIEGISNSSYKNALVEFEEGDSELSACRCFYVAFWGDILESGRNYVIFGTGRLTGNEDCSQPKFTVTHAIPFVSDFLPVHYLQILVAVDIKTALKLEADGKSYAFEGTVTGFYSDPIPANLRNDRAQRSKSTHTTTQYFYATISPRLERVLGSLRASTKIFVDGDYRFPVEESSTPAYIEVRNVNFNTTNRTSQGEAAAGGTGAFGGSGGNRRQVVLKSSPQKPKHTPDRSSHAAPASSGSADDVGSLPTPFSTPTTARITAAEPEMSFALGEFEEVSDIGTPVLEGNSRQAQKKRGHDATGSPETPKRRRKPNAKA